MWRYINSNGFSALYNKNWMESASEVGAKINGSMIAKKFNVFSFISEVSAKLYFVCLGYAWMCFSLPLCPPTRIEEALQLIKDEIESFATNSRTEQFGHDMIQDIRRVYMGSNFGSAGHFEWNFYDRLEEGQFTNNPSEGYNHRLGSRCRTSHPGIYQFTSVLGKELEDSKSKLEQLEAGSLRESQSRRSFTLQKSCLQMKIMLERKQRTLRRYLRGPGC